MDKLKFKYKVFVAIVSLFSISPIFLSALYAFSNPDFFTNIPLIENLANSYSIDVNECLKCQDNGLIFGALFILILITAILFLSLISISIAAILLKPILGWSVTSTFAILVKGNYPEEWQK